MGLCLTILSEPILPNNSQGGSRLQKTYLAACPRLPRHWERMVNREAHRSVHDRPDDGVQPFNADPFNALDDGGGLAQANHLREPEAGGNMDQIEHETEKTQGHERQTKWSEHSAKPEEAVHARRRR